MATYVNDLRLKEITTGDESGTWGASTNTNLELIAEALSYATEAVFDGDADKTTTVADGATDPARSMYYKVTGSATLSTTRTLTIAPNTMSRVMFIENATTGSQSINISQGSGANVTIATGKTKIVYLDGAGSGAAVVDALGAIEDLIKTGTAASLTQLNITAQGDLRLEDSSGGEYAAIQAPATISSSYTLTLPADDGDANQVLTTNGSGVTTWEDPAVIGKQTIYVPASAMYPNTTNGCAGVTQVELTNGPELKCLDFDASSDENAQFTVCFPKSWNEGTVTFQAFWTVTGTNTGTVAWGLSGGSIADDASINTAFGTNVVATAKAFSGTSNDMTVSAASGAVTIANAAADTQTYFQIMRDVSADNQTGDARLLGIKLFFTTDAANDD